jgi:hypothetical protein
VLLRIEYNRQAINLKVRAGTPKGVLSSVKTCKAFKPEPPTVHENLPLIQQMKTAVQQKGITLTDTVPNGADYDQLVIILYENSSLCN